jgi:CheY-like chemotaxis protein
MTKYVLDVGNCVPDHRSIKTLIESHFDAQVDQAHGQADTLAALQGKHYDLVLINRKLDRDYSDGLEILKQLKSSDQHASTPVMMITNFAEHQENATSAGAEVGFGKAELGDAETRSKLARFLED